MAISEAAYLRVGLGFVPEQVHNEMMEKKEDRTASWKLPGQEDREELEPRERRAIGLDLVEGIKDPVNPKSLSYGKSKGTKAGQYSLVMKRKKSSGVRTQPGKSQGMNQKRMAELALSALEAHGFVERRSVRMRHLSSKEKSANKREYRKNRSAILRKAATAGEKRKRRIRDKKHDRAFGDTALSGYRQYTK